LTDYIPQTHGIIRIQVDIASNPSAVPIPNNQYFILETYYDQAKTKKVDRYTTLEQFPILNALVLNVYLFDRY